MAKNRTDLNTQIDNTVFSNTEGLIDAQKENELLKQMVDSSVNKLEDAPLDNEIYILYNQSVRKLSDFSMSSGIGNVAIFSSSGSLISSNMSILDIRDFEAVTKKTVDSATTNPVLTEDVWDSEEETLTINSNVEGKAGAGSLGKTILIRNEDTFLERHGCYEVVQEYLSGTQDAILHFLGAQDIIIVTDSGYGTYIKRYDPDYPLYTKLT